MNRRFWACWLIAMMPATAFAAGTRIWEVAGFHELGMGELDGTTVSSDGEVRLGFAPKKLDFEDVGAVWTAVEGKGGDVYIGTGYDGKIFRVKDKEVRHIADTEQLVVTALVFGKNGDLYAATLPDAVIWRIPNPAQIQKGKPVKAEKWAAIEDEEVKHIWALTFGKDEKTLFAGTGPEGKVMAIGRDRKPEVYLDTEDDHILSLTSDSKGELLAGTSPSALLLRITGPGRAQALADFEGTEVKAIVHRKRSIYVGVNTFSTPPVVPSKSKTSSSTSTTSKKSTTKSKTQTGDGELYLIDEMGRMEKLWDGKKEHVVSLAVTPKGTLYAGLGADGKVISIDSSRVYRTELDLEERQVMAIVANKTLTFAGTGDAGGAYRVERARQAEATYLTPLLDTDLHSVWGRITWLAKGKLRVQSRSGNTDTPDTHWSAWSKPLQSGSEIASPPARYLQLSFSFTDDPKAALISAQVAYKPQNLRAMVTTFHPGSPFPKDKTTVGAGNISTRIVDAQPDFENEAELDLSWTVSNPDDDDLRYRLWYRTVGEKLWRPILKDDKVLESKRYTWKTGAVPEGWYQIRLVADDSPVNSPETVLSHELISVPVLVDNHQPLVQKLAYKNGQISGSAKDSFSFIGAVQFSVDGGPWMPAAPRDGVYDERDEGFSFTLPKEVEKGPHAVAVRAYDRGGNIGVSEIHITR